MAPEASSKHFQQATMSEVRGMPRAVGGQMFAPSPVLQRLYVALHQALDFPWAGVRTHFVCVEQLGRKLNSQLPQGHHHEVICSCD